MSHDCGETPVSETERHAPNQEPSPANCYRQSQLLSILFTWIEYQVYGVFSLMLSSPL